MSKQRKHPKNGEMLCSYKIGSTLGQGAFGIVKLATRANDPANTEYAVKFIDKSQMDDLDDVERIYRESAILTSLKHPNIIRLYEVLDASEWVLIIMEYADGGELKDFIASKPNNILPEHLACDILNATLNGLEYCHRRKVIHRDLKLENILIDTHGTIKIADFGLSNTIQFGTKMGTACGTPSYIAPEIVRGDSAKSGDSKSSGAECDIWSLGVILYCMICGFLPFQSSNIKGLYDKILRADYTIPDYISPQSKSLVTKMLTVDLEKRINLSQIRTHCWTQMRSNGLIDDIKSRDIVTAEQIHIAATFNMTRKKAKLKSKEEQSHDAFTSDESHSIELNEKDGPRSHLVAKHSKSLDRELAQYIKGKTTTVPLSMSSPKSRRRSSGRSAINNLKNKLNRLKLDKPNVSTAKTPRMKGNDKRRSKTPTAKGKKNVKEQSMLKSPDPPKAKAPAFHSPIVDSIMRRKPDLASQNSWKMDLKEYPDLSRHRADPLRKFK